MPRSKRRREIDGNEMIWKSPNNRQKFETLGPTVYSGNVEEVPPFL